MEASSKIESLGGVVAQVVGGCKRDEQDLSENTVDNRTSAMESEETARRGFVHADHVFVTKPPKQESLIGGWSGRLEGMASAFGQLRP